MPDLNLSLMITTATARFLSFQLVAPPAPAAAAGRAVSNVASRLPRPGLKISPRLGGASLPRPNPVAPRAAKAATPLPSPPALFRSSGNTEGDVALQRQYSEEYQDFIEKMCLAIQHGHAQWRQAALLRGVRVNSVVATGGRLDGPELAPLIKPRVPANGCVGQAQRDGHAIAHALSRAWKLYGDGVRVPALNWYPAFAAFPAPSAPPTPNLPTPLLNLPSVASHVLTVNALTSNAVIQLGAPPGPYGAALFEAIATGFASAVTAWLPVQQVMNVMGKGPIPTFAPPYVPVGPVVNGDIIETPGHLAT